MEKKLRLVYDCAILRNSFCENLEGQIFCYNVE